MVSRRYVSSVYGASPHSRSLCSSGEADTEQLMTELFFFFIKIVRHHSTGIFPPVITHILLRVKCSTVRRSWHHHSQPGGSLGAHVVVRLLFLLRMRKPNSTVRLLVCWYPSLERQKSPGSLWKKKKKSKERNLSTLAAQCSLSSLVGVLCMIRRDVDTCAVCALPRVQLLQVSYTCTVFRR